MSNKYSISEYMSCNNCLIALGFLDMAMSNIKGGTRVQSMIREFAKDFIGTSYDPEQISNHWDNIKKVLMKLDIPEGTTAKLAFLSMEETIHTLKLSKGIPNRSYYFS